MLLIRALRQSDKIDFSMQFVVIWEAKPPFFLFTIAS